MIAHVRETPDALDPIQYPGHTTTLDRLWMGVPSITLSGKTAASRGGVSILRNLGYTELIARSEEEYVSIAASLAVDFRGLSKIRMGLRDKMKKSVLMDEKQFALDVETVYREVWEKWCRGDEVGSKALNVPSS